MRRTLSTVSATLVISIALLGAQTRVEAPENSYEPSEDVKLGREAAAEVRRELPLLKDEQVTSYVSQLGQRLARQVRSDLRHDGFRYTFDVVNAREINAFALPGGPTFVNRGMLEAARTEGEVAGVLAHEIAHVALRHGTAQASKATPFQFGQLAGAIIGAVVGGNTGAIISQTAQITLGTVFLKYGREYERDADIEGAHLMARAGYDPREMANMFRTIEKQGGSSGPEWLSSHPNPGNRYEAITREAELLRVDNPVGNSGEFNAVKNRLKKMPKAPATKRPNRS
jgi:beta-barrel assembly-enhancing protease